MEIKYRIVTMDEVEFRYKPEFDYSSINKDNISYQFAHEMTPNNEKGELALKIFVEITPEESNEILVKEVVYCVFQIDPFNQVVQVQENGFKTTEPQLINTFISVAIGALRGMLVKNLKSTPLAGCVMPLIPMSVISQNVAQLNKSQE